MRYENWDVLLFPEDSSAPLQEFKTQCFVTRDTDSSCSQLSTMMSPHEYYNAKGGYLTSNLRQSPVLTSFIPSLYKDTPFRVSIHNWDKPQPSQFIERQMQPDDYLTFEVRVFIDGVLCAGAYFGHQCKWPVVIKFGYRIDILAPTPDSASADMSLDLDRNGNQDPLRFPAFHPEILDQQHWDAGDPFGRIKVIIAEGLARPKRSPPFERFKDVVIMSFQHAPLQVLEHSSIAWPNPNMWIQEGSVESLWSSMRDSERRVRAQDETTHGHSPIRSEPRLLASSMTLPNSSHDMAAWATGRAFPIPTHHPHRLGEPPLWGFGAERYDPSFGKNGLDAFVSEEAWTHRGARSSHEDVPMPDYSISSGSRAISSMTGVSYEHSKQPSIEAILDEDQYNELLQALTPTKAPVIGTRAPSNTPSAVPVTTPTNMPAPAKPSGAPEVRLHRRTHGSARGLGSGRASALREVSQPSTRDVSGSSNRSNIPPEKTTTPSKATPPANFGISPSANVKGKKEGPNENIKISPKRTPQKDAIGATSQDGKLNDDRNPGEKEQENAVHEDEDVISACII